MWGLAAAGAHLITPRFLLRTYSNEVALYMYNVLTVSASVFDSFENGTAVAAFRCGLRSTLAACSSSAVDAYASAVCELV